MKNNKIFIIRFSSFGDVVQAMSVVGPIKRHFPNLEIHWVSKNYFSDLLSLCPGIDQIHVMQGKGTLLDLWNLIKKIDRLNPTYIYDAHSNIRSFFIKLYFSLRIKNRPIIFSRPKNRVKRLLFFGFRINTFPIWPIKGMQTYLTPLKSMKLIEWQEDLSPQIFNFSKIKKQFHSKYSTLPEKFIVMAPGAAWAMKRWPENNWKNLVKNLGLFDIVFLGGQEDYEFCEQLKTLASPGSLNLAGKISFAESAYVVNQSAILISADTGVLHVADLLGKKALGLFGPTAFGFPTSPSIKVLENEEFLPCRPCSKDGRGQCVREIYQECMVGISPVQVVEALNQSLLPKALKS